MDFPTCPKCGKSQMVPFSDFAGSVEHHAITTLTYKAWSCLACHYTAHIHKGEVIFKNRNCREDG